jgi:hypothetical protein
VRWQGTLTLNHKPLCGETIEAAEILLCGSADRVTGKIHRAGHHEVHGGQQIGYGKTPVFVNCEALFEDSFYLQDQLVSKRSYGLEELSCVSMTVRLELSDGRKTHTKGDDHPCCA